MVDNSKEVRKQILDVIGCIAAVITILVYVVLCVNAIVVSYGKTFIPETSFVMNVLRVIQTYAPLVVVGIVGLEFIANKHIVLRILFYILIALVVIFMFFPSTWSHLVGIIS